MTINDGADAVSAPELAIKDELADVQEEVAALRCFVPKRGTTVSDALARNFFCYIQELLQRSKAVTAALGVDVERAIALADLQVPLYDYSLPTYDELEATHASSVKWLQQSGVFAESWSTLVFASRDTIGLLLPWWVVKLFSLFGIEEDDLVDVGSAFIETIGEELYDQIREALDAEDWDRLWDLLQRALDAFTDLKRRGEFLNRLLARLARRLSGTVLADKVKTLAAKIGSKFVPIVGWLGLIFDLIMALINNYRKIV